jgi:hypothetical protein
MPDLTPAEELRAAARLMRKRATEATPGPWERPLGVPSRSFVGAALPEGEQGRYRDGLIGDWATKGYLSRYRGQRERVSVVSCATWDDGTFVRQRSGRDLEYIASMHPLVALAVADWLDATAGQAEAELYEATADDLCCGTPGACSGHPGILTCNKCAEPFPEYCHCWDAAFKVARAYLNGRDDA